MPMARIISLVVFFCILHCLYTFSAIADCISRDTVSVKFMFRSGVSEIDSAFSDNAAAIRSIRAVFNDASAGKYGIGAVSLRSSASPEGSFTFNRTLCDGRLRSLYEYVPQLRDFTSGNEQSGVDWAMLSSYVEASEKEWKEDVLDIICNTPVWVFDGNIIVDGRKRRLMNLHGGRTWNELSGMYFPHMRYVECSVEREIPDSVPVVVKKCREPLCLSSVSDFGFTDNDTGFYVVADTCVRTDKIYATAADGGSDVDVALGTNLLYDMALVPNLGVEVSFGRHWTLSAYGMYAWWSRNASHRYWRLYGGEFDFKASISSFLKGNPEAVPFVGHYAGIYFQMLSYDLEFGGKGYLADRWTYGAGISYSYYLAAGSRFRFGFNIGVGYLWGRYKGYHPEDDCYVWDRTSMRRWFGPTKAGVSLVYILGAGGGRKGGGK